MYILEKYLVILDYTQNIFFPGKGKEHHTVLGLISAYKLDIFVCVCNIYT